MILLLRLIAVGMMTVIMALGVYLAVPSSSLVHPIALTLDGDQLTFVRETPYGAVDVMWSSEIVMLENEGFECGGSGVRNIQPSPRNLVRAKIGRWADYCISLGPPFVLRYQYRAMLFGWLPLRPTEIVITVEAKP